MDITRIFKRPEEITHQFALPFQRFLEKEAASSILLLVVTTIALLWANSPLAPSYHHFWESHLSVSVGGLSISKTLREWIDEGLMSVFFFTVGLEIKREVMVGELASLKKAFLPLAAAVGGMVLPAVIYYAMNASKPTAYGWGVPMATDIAFSLSVIYMLGRRLPVGLRVFLSAFAIADDLGAVFVIALFYTKKIMLHHLLLSGFMVLMVATANFLWIRRTLIYGLLGVFLWLTILGSGVHATVAGILVAMFIPARGKYDTDVFIKKVGLSLNRFECPTEGCGNSILLNQDHLNAVQAIEEACHDAATPLQRIEHALHPWVTFVVVPLFALANAGLTFKGLDLHAALISPVFSGIMLGLLIGKPMGITAFSFLAVKAGFARLPERVGWRHIIGAGIVGGIGFTMSLFITGLSFQEPLFRDQAKMAILLASSLAGLLGLGFLTILGDWRR